MLQNKILTFQKAKIFFCVETDIHVITRTKFSLWLLELYFGSEPAPVILMLSVFCFFLFLPSGECICVYVSIGEH